MILTQWHPALPPSHKEAMTQQLKPNILATCLFFFNRAVGLLDQGMVRMLLVVERVETLQWSNLG